MCVDLKEQTSRAQKKMKRAKRPRGHTARPAHVTLDDTDSKFRQRALVESHLPAAWAMIPHHVINGCLDNGGEASGVRVQSRSWTLWLARYVRLKLR